MRTAIKKILSITLDVIAIIGITLSVAIAFLYAFVYHDWNTIVCYIIVAITVFIVVFFYLENKYNKKNKQ